MSTDRTRPSAMGALVVLAAFAACSSGEVEPPTVEVQNDDGGNVLEDADREDVVDSSAADASKSEDAGDAGDAGVPQCTVDWCEVPLPIPVGGTLKLMDVWVPAKNDAWAVSEEGHVLRWNGTAWSIVWSSETALYGIWGDHEGAIWVVGAGGAIFRGVDGAGWARIPSGVTTDLLGICEGTRDAEHQRNISIVGAESTVLRWTGDNGEDGKPVWATSTLGPLDRLYSISCAGLDVWVSGTNTDWWDDSGGRIYVNGGAGWEALTALSGTENFNRYETFVAVWAHDRQNVWARGGVGIVHSAPGGPEGGPKWSRAETRAATDVTRPAAIWGTAANDVWIVSTRGRIHHWDGSSIAITATAKTWDVLQANLHAVSGSGPDDVWVIGDNVALHRNVQKVGQ